MDGLSAMDKEAVIQKASVLALPDHFGETVLGHVRLLDPHQVGVRADLQGDERAGDKQ